MLLKITRGLHIPLSELIEMYERNAQAEQHASHAEGSFTDIRDTLDNALDLLADPQAAYN